MTIWGQNFVDGVIVVLQSGSTQINGTNVVVGHVGNEETIDAEFALPAISKGVYNLIITNPATNPVTQISAFEIFSVGDTICATPPC